VANSEPAQYFEVLLGLRHDTFVGRHQQHREIDAACARDHAPHEALVPRHIDNTDENIVGERKRCKAELNGDAAFFFFFETVGVVAGERFDELRLAMVDVAGGAENEVAGALGRGH
jgi:hypothetical protein